MMLAMIQACGGCLDAMHVADKQARAPKKVANAVCTVTCSNGADAKFNMHKATCSSDNMMRRSLVFV